MVKYLHRGNIVNVSSLLLMILMMIFPAKLYGIKIVLLGLLFALLIGKVKISKPIIVLWLFLFLSILWGVTVGVLKGTAYPFHGITTSILWPTLGIIIVLPQLMEEINFVRLFHYLFYIHSFIIIYDILYAFHIIWDFPFYDLYPEVEVGFSFYGTSSRLNLDDNLNVLTFTIPVYFLIWLSKYDIKINRLFQTIMIIAAFFLMILSGRRSLMLVFVLAPILIIICARFFPKDTVNVNSIKRMFFVFLILLLIVFFYLYSYNPEIIEGYSDLFLKAFDSDEESTKFVQAKMLWENFLDNFFWGSGNGTVFYESARGVRQHQFELTYHLILATRGIIGGFLYFSGILGVLFWGVRLFFRAHDMMLLFLMFGYLFVLIANGTNPVLSSFDLMLPLYFCYAKINSLAFRMQK